MTLIYLLIAVVVISALVVLFAHLFVPSPPPDCSDADILEALRQGDTIRALRYHRHLHRSSLKSAKAAVENMAALNGIELKR